jgi:hypothetical protein
VAISIQRKTDITDEQEFTTGQPFNAESFEFQCDKLTMILQEINASVCDCSAAKVIVPPPPDPVYCKVYACDAYKTAGEALFENFWPMNGSTANTAPGGTGLGVFGTVTYNTLGNLLTDSCFGTKGMFADGSNGARSTSSVISSPGKSGMFSGFLKLTASTSVTLFSNLYYLRQGDQELIYLVWTSGFGNGLQLRCSFPDNVGAVLVNIPSGLSTSTPNHVFLAWRIENVTLTSTRRIYFTLYLDFVEVITSSATFTDPTPWSLNWSPDFRIGANGGDGGFVTQFVGHSPFAPDDLADCAPIVAALHEAYLRNDVDYVDPDPECVPPPE